LLPGYGNVLAGEPTAYNIGKTLLGLESANVVVYRNGGPMLAQHLLTEGFFFDKLNCLKTADQLLCGIRESSNT
jgi:hypothetical protein